MAKRILKKKSKPTKKAAKGNYAFFDNLPEPGFCYQHITWNDVDRLNGESLIKFLEKELDVDLEDHPEAQTYDQILVGICRFLDKNPSKYDQLFMY